MVSTNYEPKRRYSILLCCGLLLSRAPLETVNAFTTISLQGGGGVFPSRTTGRDNNRSLIDKNGGKKSSPNTSHARRQRRVHQFSETLLRLSFDAADPVFLSSMTTWLQDSSTANVLSSLAGSATSIQVPIHFLPDALAQYQNLLSTNPITTKSITAGILGCAGDAIAQVKSHQTTKAEKEESNSSSSSRRFEYDWKRGLAFLTFGSFYTGCFQHFWFTTLNQNIQDWGEDIHVWGHPAETNIALDSFTHKENWWEFFDVVDQIDGIMARLPDPPSKATLALAKVSMNQFFVIPFVYMPLFFAITGAVAGMSFELSLARAQSLYMPLMRRNYLFWFPMQFLQFWVLPNEWQIPFLSVASLCWTVILSSIGGSSPPSSTNVAYETTTVAAPAGQDSKDPSLRVVDENEDVFSYDTNISTIVTTTILEEIGQQRDEGQGSAEEIEEVVKVIPNQAGPINDISDGVRFEDVQKVLVPNEIVEVVSDPKIRSTVGGLALGVLTGAADDAAIGAFIGNTIGGFGVTPGIALTAVLGAGIAYAMGDNKNNIEEKRLLANDDNEEAGDGAMDFHPDYDDFSSIIVLQDDEVQIDNSFQKLLVEASMTKEESRELEAGDSSLELLQR